MPTWLIVIAVLIVVSLAVVALILHWKLYQQDKLRQRWERLSLEQEEAAQTHTKDSIDFICRALLAEQVECGEASIRISHLLDRLELDEAAREPYVVFDKVRVALDHIPIKEEWKALDRKVRKNHLKTIERVEREYREFAAQTAKQVVDKPPLV